MEENWPDAPLLWQFQCQTDIDRYIFIDISMHLSLSKCCIIEIEKVVSFKNTKLFYSRHYCSQLTVLELDLTVWSSLHVTSRHFTSHLRASAMKPAQMLTVKTALPGVLQRSVYLLFSKILDNINSWYLCPCWIICFFPARLTALERLCLVPGKIAALIVSSSRVKKINFRAD